MSLIIQDKESELSYAYLHAVAGKAGMSCTIASRHDDNAGVDAMVQYRGPLSHPYLTHIHLNIQLKATIKSPGTLPNHASYFLNGVSRYDKLRIVDSDIYKILVVLFLPSDPDKWLKCTQNELILKDSAYWTCLYGAQASTNATGETVYLPRANKLTPDSLLQLVNLAANKTVPIYQRPS